MRERERFINSKLSCLDASVITSAFYFQNLYHERKESKEKDKEKYFLLMKNKGEKKISNETYDVVVFVQEKDRKHLRNKTQNPLYPSEVTNGLFSSMVFPLLLVNVGLSFN